MVPGAPGVIKQYNKIKKLLEGTLWKGANIRGATFSDGVLDEVLGKLKSE